MPRLWRTRHGWTRSVHGQARLGPWRLGFHAHLHNYPLGHGKRLVLQPFVVVDW